MVAQTSIVRQEGIQRNNVIARSLSSIELDLERNVYKESYFEFFKFAFGVLYPNEPYEDNFHVKYLCDILQAEVFRIKRREAKTTDLVVNIPPRSSKTLIFSVVFPAWCWLHIPTATFICVSYDEELALLNAQYCRDIIASEEYQLLFSHIYKLRPDTNAKGLFMNNKGGFRLSKTTGNNITGHKGLFIIIDDPQNPTTAASELERKKSTNYYDKSLYNRLTPITLGCRITIMQRLHVEDLTGHLLNTKKEIPHRHICLPAQINEKNIKAVKPAELAQHYTNGLLDPRRLPESVLKDFTITLGTSDYTGQYLQDPVDEKGGMVQRSWFKIIHANEVLRDPRREFIDFYIDSAYTIKTQNDPTAILVCFRQGTYLYIINVVTVRMIFPDLCAFIPKFAYQMGYTQGSRIIVEPKASGLSIVQQLQTIPGLNVIKGETPKDDKLTRFASCTPKMEAGNVVLISGPYITPYLDELVAFPLSPHDDMVDVTSAAITHKLNKNLPLFGSM